MAGNTFGTIFRVTTFGESHGAAVGAVIDGCPAGLPLCEEDIQTYLDRRKPGASRFSTARKEGDLCRILSGVFEGKTTGTPIAVIVENTDQRSGDYSALRDVYRPGHADLGYDRKYGFRDYRGGGRSSGRETAGRVIGGAVAAKLLKEFGVEIRAWTDSIGPFRADPEHSELSERPFPFAVLQFHETPAGARSVLRNSRTEAQPQFGGPSDTDVVRIRQGKFSDACGAPSIVRLSSRT